MYKPFFELFISHAIFFIFSSHSVAFQVNAVFNLVSLNLDAHSLCCNISAGCAYFLFLPTTNTP